MKVEMFVAGHALCVFGHDLLQAWQHAGIGAVQGKGQTVRHLLHVTGAVAGQVNLSLLFVVADVELVAPVLAQPQDDAGRLDGDNLRRAACTVIRF